MQRFKKRKIRAVLFDWDGTLLDSYAADAAAYLAMFRKMQIAWGLEDLAQHYSPNWYNVYRAAGSTRAAGPKPIWHGAPATPRKSQNSSLARAFCWQPCAGDTPSAWSPAVTATASSANYARSACCGPSPPTSAVVTRWKKSRIPRPSVWPCASCTWTRATASTWAIPARTSTWRVAPASEPSA